MNWLKKIIKVAAADSKINKLGIANPSLKLFVHRYENAVGIDWNKIKTSEDIETYIINNLLPPLHEKIDPRSKNNNYLKSEHLDLAGEFAQHPDDPQVQMAQRIYERDPQAATQHILDSLNKGKKEGFDQWWNYLTKEGELYKNNPAFIYSILKPIIDSSPENAKNGPPPLNAEALATIWEEVNEQGVTQMNVLKNYRKISSELDKQGIQSVTTGGEGEWIKIPSKKSDPQNYKENIDKLMRFAQGSGWCIAQSSYANTYLSEGDFWLYLLNGRATVAIRMTGSNNVAEIRGHNNDIKNLEPYWQEVTNFLHQSPFNYKDNVQYKHIEEIYFLNANLEKGSPDYNTVLEKIKQDHTTYLRLSDENRKKFPEFLNTAIPGYKEDLDNKLLEIESPGFNIGEYLRKFENFQDYYKKLPEEIKISLGSMNERILQAHKKAYYNNPIIFAEFSPEIQNKFSKEEQISAWNNYVNTDPYHYNDPRIPKQIIPYIPINSLKNKWKELIQKNTDHIDYIKPDILKLFSPGEIENYIIQDFAKFPVSRVNGRLNKLDRVEKLVSQGRIDKQQIVDILVNSVKQNPKWINMLPDSYKQEIMNKGNISKIVEEEKKRNIIRDTGYFKNLSPKDQNALLQQHGEEIGQAFANDLNKYRGLYHQFWINTPVNVRPYLPYDLIDNVAQFYADQINRNPNNQETILKQISPDIQPFVSMKLGKSKNWYKKAQLKSLKDIKDHLEKILGLEKYEPKNLPKRKRKNDNECCHSLDMHCDGGDDGY